MDIASRSLEQAGWLNADHDHPGLAGRHDPALSTLLQLGALGCDTHLALLCCADADHHWVEAASFPPSVAEALTALAFCSHPMADAEVVQEAHRHLLAGTPVLADDGRRLGTLVIMDAVARQLSEAQRAILRRVALLAADALQKRSHGATRQPDALALTSFQMASQVAPHGVFHTDSFGNCVYANPAMLALFGMTQDALPSAAWLDRLGADDKIRVLHAWRTCALEGLASDLRVALTVPDGATLSLALRARPLAPQRRGASVAGYVDDMSQQLAQARRLDKSERLLDRIGRLAGAGGWEFNVQSQRVYWSDETCRLHGREPGHQPSFREALAYYTKEAQPIIHSEILMSINSGSSWDVELPMVTCDGRHIVVRAVGSSERENGKVVGLFGVLQDVTERVKERNALALANARLALATDAGSVGVFDIDLITGVQLWDAHMFKVFGITHEGGVVARDFWTRFVNAEERATVEHAVRSAFGAGLPVDIECQVNHADQSIHTVRGSGRLLKDATGRPVHVVGTVMDVTEAERLKTALAQQHELMRVTLKSIGDAVITTDIEERVKWLNPVAEKMTGWSSADARGARLDQLFQIVHQETRSPLPSPVTRCLLTGEMTLPGEQTMLLARDGREYGIEDSAAPIRNEHGEVLGAVLVFHDVSQQRAHSSDMRHRASHDGLTGLVNRAEFENRIQRLLTAAHADERQHALLYIDLDQFKLVNVNNGRAVGDELLQQVARVLGEGIRARDTLARLGGDEFAILLEECHAAQAARVAQQVCDRMDAFRFDHAGRRIRVGVSIGLVPIDARWENTEAILQAADTACSVAKEAGRNRVHTWFDSDSELRNRRGQVQWTSKIEYALDHDAFVLHAQRIMDINGQSKGIHAEVLLRMLADDGVSLILPGLFLPAAERFHLASRIDRWVLKNVVTWMAQRPGFTELSVLSVNLSGQSVGDRDFHAWAIALLSVAGPTICTRLCLEITETAAVTNLHDAGTFISQLHQLGVRIALDDFGAGASSFGYLKKLPIDYLKIDGQFVRNLLTDRLDEAALVSFASVASVINIPTVAEYVDSEAILAKVRTLGIHFAQGFLLHEPGPIDELWPD
ncbi:MAG: EAL domain-containing protein [Pseudomonadota bacterium]